MSPGLARRANHHVESPFSHDSAASSSSLPQLSATRSVPGLAAKTEGWTEGLSGIRASYDRLEVPGISLENTTSKLEDR